MSSPQFGLPAGVVRGHHRIGYWMTRVTMTTWESVCISSLNMRCEFYEMLVIVFVRCFPGATQFEEHFANIYMQQIAIPDKDWLTFTVGYLKVRCCYCYVGS